MLVQRRILLAAAGTLAAAGLARKPRAAGSHPLRGIEALVPTDPPKPPPAFVFTTAEGAKRSLADYAGQGVVLNCWATWCQPCIAEMSALDALAGRVAGAGVAVLPLASDRGGAEVVRAFYAQHGIAHLPVLLDPEGAATHVLGLRGIPTTVLFDREGRERGRIEGAVDWSSNAAEAVVLRLAGAA